MTGRGKPIASYADNRVTLTSLTLCTHFAESVDHHERNRQYQCERIPLKRAYVICRQRRGSAANGSTSIRFGRTNDDAEVVEPARESYGPDDVEVTSPTGASNDFELMWLDMAETHEIFWCYDRRYFEEALAALIADPDCTPPRLSARTLRMLPHRSTTSLYELKLFDSGAAGGFAGPLLVSRGPSDGYLHRRRHVGGGTDFYFDVTPPSLRALFLAEFIQWYSAKAVLLGTDHWNALMRAKNIAEATLNNSPDAELERRLKAEVKPGSRAWRVLEHYRDFANQCACATGRVSKRDFVDAIGGYSVTGSQSSRDEWRSLIRKLHEGGCTHPLERANSRESDAILFESSYFALLDYFDMYRLGVELLRDRVPEQLTADLNTLIRAAEDPSELIRQHLNGAGDHASFLVDLDLYCVQDTRLRSELWSRHTSIMASVDLSSIGTFEAYTAREWASLAPHMKWMTAVQGGAAALCTQLLEKEFALVRAGVEEANAIMNSFYRYHHAASQNGTIYEEVLAPVKTRARVDFGSQTITLLDHPEQSARFTFTHAVQTMPVEELSRPDGYIGTSVRGKLYRKAVSRELVLDFDVIVPVDRAAMLARREHWPKGLDSAASILNLACTIFTAQEKLAEQDIEAWMDVGQNSLQALDGVAVFHAAVLASRGEAVSAPLLQIAGGLKRFVGVIDGVRNVRDGYRILYGDDSPVYTALADGDDVRALAIGAKGALQFTLGTSGAALAGSELLVLGGAASTGFLAVAAGPVGIALAVGGLVVASIELGLSLTERFDVRTREFHDAWRQATHVELRDHREEAQTVRRLHQLCETMSRTV